MKIAGATLGASLALLFIFLSEPPFSTAGHGVEDTVDNLPADRVKQLMDAGEKLVLIDMRPLKEYRKSRLPGARSLPLAELADRFAEIPKTGRVVLYCDCKPYDVADRAVFLEYRGYRNISVMPEGYQGWLRRGFPIETDAR
ncbi:MAG TPA: rhodanese-like domain-containing protein [Candidatus Acidoferrales bacterium]|nr:rhodanese-like domain-containing protein [Candidatus Acidoferrales bacterium]